MQIILRTALALLVMLQMSLVFGADSAAAAVEPSAAFKSDGDIITAGLITRIIVGLVFITAIGFGLAYLARRYLHLITGYTTVKRDKKINIVELRRVTPKLVLLLVDVEGEQFLIASAGDTVNVIKNWPKPATTE